MIYVVLIDGSKLTEPQHHRLLEEILRLGDGASEIVGDLRDTVPPVPLKYNVVDAPFETVRGRVDKVVDAFYAKNELDEVERLRTEVERLTECLARANSNHEEFERRWYLASDEVERLRAALTEALDIFDATWCPEHGHAPKPEQHARVAELRKLVHS